MRIGNDANCHATSCCSALPGSSPRRDIMARCMPASWACANVRERGGGMVRNRWWHLGPAHWTNTCQAHCRSGIQGMAFHSFSSSSMRSQHAAFSNASVPTGVPRIFIPCGLQTSGGKSPILGGCTLLLGSTPAFFQRGVESPLPLPTNMDCSCAFGQADHEHVIKDAKRCSPGKRSRFTSHKELCTARLNRRGRSGSPCSPPSCCPTSRRAPCSSSHA